MFSVISCFDNEDREYRDNNRKYENNCRGEDCQEHYDNENDDFEEDDD